MLKFIPKAILSIDGIHALHVCSNSVASTRLKIYFPRKQAVSRSSQLSIPNQTLPHKYNCECNPEFIICI